MTYPLGVMLFSPVLLKWRSGLSHFERKHSTMEQKESKGSKSKGASLYPLSPEDAIGGILETDPERVHEAEEQEKLDRKTRRKRAVKKK